MSPAKPGSSPQWAPSRKNQASSAKKPSRRKLRTADVAWICSQLATTQGAGMPLHRSLGMLSSQRSGTVVGERLAELQQALSDGKSLAQAMALRTDEYSPLVVALVGAGESSGNAELAFRQCADYLNSRMRLRSKVRTAMLYPSAILVIALGLVAVLMVVVVPKFEAIYEQTGGELPAMTQVVVAASAQFPLFLAGVGILVALGAYTRVQSRRDARLRARMDRAKFALPLVGKLSRQAADARVASTMASLLGSGVSLLEALDYAAQSAGSSVHAAALMEVKERLGEGATLAAAMERTQVFPELMVQLIAVGEESGSLAGLLEKYATTASEQVEETASSLTTLVEPAIMVVIGGIVGVFLLALYLPIISVSQNIQ